MDKLPSLEGIQKAEKIEAEFDDYTRFDLDASVRADQTEKFLAGDVYTPSYVYPNLENLDDARLTKAQSNSLKAAIKNAEELAKNDRATDSRIGKTARTLAKKVMKFTGQFSARTEEQDNEEISSSEPHAWLDATINAAKTLQKARGIKQAMPEKKTKVQSAVFYLESAKGTGVVSDAELELYEKFYEIRLMRMGLADAARRLNHSASSSEDEVNRHAYRQLNELLYGPLNNELAHSMFATELTTAQNFVAHNAAARTVRDELLSMFGGKEFTGNEPKLMSNKDLQTLRDFVLARYAPVLAALPGTDDTVFYDAEQCAEYMRAAIDVNGLADNGWTVRVSKEKGIPTTNDENQEIILPSTTRRTASQLRRLTIHEAEVHARRSQNGIDTGVGPLRKGTADYADVEEGLGVLLECALEGNFDNPSYDRARDRYITAGLALGADGAPRDANQTFSILWRMLALRQAQDGKLDSSRIVAAKREAYTHIENAFRGTPYAMPGMIFTKLKVYYEGLEKNAKFFTQHIDDLDTTFDTIMIGKYDHTSTDETALVEDILAAKTA